MGGAVSASIIEATVVCERAAGRSQMSKANRTASTDDAWHAGDFWPGDFVLGRTIREGRACRDRRQGCSLGGPVTWMRRAILGGATAMGESG